MRMKSILKSIYSFLEAFSKARAAAELSRCGKWKEAQALYKN
jgi:hypothetical protein